MNQATPAIWKLARLLLTLEAAQQEHGPDEVVHTAMSVLEKLHAYLNKLVGVAGFQALLSRALALAKLEVDWLKALRVSDDATLVGFRETVQHHTAEAVAQGSVALLAQLLGLLVTFIGEALTLRLIMDVWPQVQGDTIYYSVEETS